MSDLETLLAQYADDVEDDTPETVEEPVVDKNAQDEELIEKLVAAATPSDDDEADVPETPAEPEAPLVSTRPVVDLENLDPLVFDLGDKALETISLGSSGCLVELSTGEWGNRKNDKVAAEAIANATGADVSMVNGSKKLLKSETLKAIKAVIADARKSTHYRLTMPWGDNGWRYLPASNYMDYFKLMDGKAQEIQDLVDRFGDEYAVLREDSRQTLGSLFDEKLYPSVEAVKKKFKFRYQEMPVPERGDWRVDLENESQRSQRESYDKFYREQVSNAVAERWEIARKEVLWLIERMTDETEGKSKKFRENRLDELKGLISILDTFNLTNDPKLTEAARSIERTIKDLDAEALRNSESLRKKTKDDLQKALDSLPTLGL